MAALVALAVLAVAATIASGLSRPRGASHPSGLGASPVPAVRTFSSWLNEAQVRATTTAQWQDIARDNAIVVLNSWDFRLIPILKKANPKVQVWVYKNLSGVRSDDCTTPSGNCGSCGPGVQDSAYLSSGMGYCWIRRNHPDWLLSAAGTGQPFRFRGFSQIWAADYGNPAYQQQWFRNVLADLRGQGWDGVEVDNALTTANAYGTAARYPTDAAVQAATYSALRRIGPALHEALAPAVFNVGFATMFPGLWQHWLGTVDGLLQEFYLSFSTRPNASGTTWSLYENEVSACVAQHKSCWFHTGEFSPGITAQTRQYALASFLLATDGRQLLAVGSSTSPPLQPQLMLGGRPSSMFQAGQVWLRYFAQGVAIVNPSTAAAVIPLQGTYLDGAGHRIGTLTLGPASGASLHTAANAGPG